MVNYHKDKNLPNRFKECRLEKKLSQPKLAVLLGFKPNKQTIYCYETNKRIPDVNTLIMMHNILEVSTDYLLALDDYKTHNDYLLDALGIDDELLYLFNNIQTIYEMKRINTYIHRHYKEWNNED